MLHDHPAKYRPTTPGDPLSELEHLAHAMRPTLELAAKGAHYDHHRAATAPFANFHAVEDRRQRAVWADKALERNAAMIAHIQTLLGQRETH